MKVSDLFFELSVGELSNLAISNEGSGDIREEDYSRLMVYANGAILALYKRFILKTNELLLQPVEHITNYHLLPQYSLSSNSTERHKYIIDSEGAPFLDDVIKVMELITSYGETLPLEEPANSRSVFIVGPKTLQLPTPIPNMAVSVIYQAEPVPLKFRDVTPAEILDQTVPIPSFLKPALFANIAFRMYSYMNGQEHTAKANEYMALYEAECESVTVTDQINQTSSNNHTKLEERGFV